MGEDLVMDYILQNPKFLGKKRRQEFGKIAAKSWLTGSNQRWFSIDSDGRVRSHYIYTSGYYRS